MLFGMKVSPSLSAKMAKVRGEVRVRVVEIVRVAVTSPSVRSVATLR